MLNLLLILMALFLVLLNGFFVAAEFAMVKVRHTRVQTLGQTSGMRGRILAKVHGRLDAYLSACQLGITLTSLGLGWIGEPAVAHLLQPVLEQIGIVSKDAIEIISFIVAFSIISFLHIVVGELMPKTIAIRQSERISLWTAIPLYIFYWTMYPAIYFLNISANFFLKVCRLDATSHGEQSYSSQELKFILKASHLHGEFTKTEADLIEQTLEFADLEVSDVMRPINELVALDNKNALADNFKKIAEHRYTRYPLYHNNKQNMLGVVHVKDVFAAWQNAANFQELKTLVRPLKNVGIHDSALELLQIFRQGSVHLALVYDEESLVGFITLDNLLQVIIGRIKDEFHRTQQDWISLEDGGFELQGYASIYILEQLLDLDLSQYPVTTVGGLVLHRLERFPEQGEKLEFEQFDLIVTAVAAPKINLVRVYPKDPDVAADSLDELAAAKSGGPGPLKIKST